MALIKFDGCDKCSLKQDWPMLRTPRMKMAPPSEEGEYKILILGEAPGAEEDQDGVPFVGKAGKLLRTYLPKNWINKVWWQNVVRCRPTEENGRKNRTPTQREVACCSKYLQDDLCALKPHAILGFGNIALDYFWPGANVSKLRGLHFPVKLRDGTMTWFMSTFHPSYVMRAQREYDGQITNSVAPVFKHDIIQFFKNIPQFATPPQINLPSTNILYPKTKEEALRLFSLLKPPYAIDFETMKLKPWMRDAKLLCAACSDGQTTFSFPIDWPGDVRKWGLEALGEMILSGKEWIAQHATMELAWIMGKLGLRKQKFHDLEVVARLLHQRKGVGSLDVLSKLYLGLDIKELTNKSLKEQMLGPLDKGRISEYSQEQILEYCALDSWSEAVIFYKLFDCLPVEQKENYYRILQTLESIVAMELVGLDVNKEESERLEKDLYTKSNALEKEAGQLQEVKSFEAKEQKIFNLGSPAVVGHVMANYCGINLPRDEETENISTDSSYLEPLLGKHKIIEILLDFREVEKLRGTYVDPILRDKVLGADYRLHPSYTAVHTATYRLSSEWPNIQNFPKRKHKEVRRQVVARKGYIFAAFDYGQLEARTLVMASKDPVLKQAFINHEDIHSKWLNRLLDIYPPYLDRLALATGQTDPEKIKKAGRDTIKTDLVFASFYGSVARSISERAMIPMDVAIQILREFWNEYKGVRNWIDEQFRRYNTTGVVTSLTKRLRNEVLPGNEIINTPIQGTAAEMVEEAQNALYYLALEHDINLMPRINIHDDLVFELPDNSSLGDNVEIIQKEIVKPRFPFVNLPLMTECRVGPNWCDLVSVARFEGPWYEEGKLVTSL